MAPLWITNLLTQIDINQFEENLVESLIKKSIKENKLETPGYDPLKHRMITQKEK